MRTIGHILLAAGLLGCGTACAQVRVDRAVTLTGTLTEDRQVLGLPASTSPWRVLSAATEQDGTHRFADPVAGAVWQAEVPSLPEGPVVGTQLIIRAPGPLKTQVQLQVNGLGPFPLTLQGQVPFTGEALSEGEPLSLVFDGTGFQVLNGTLRTLRACPDDMVAVNDAYCIDQVQHATAFWYDAVLACASEGKRLCSWGEFYVACTYREELGVPDLFGDSEWTNNTANFSNVVRVVGAFCQGAGAATTTSTPRAYHCCLTR
ncbi:MAG: hypothetical protein KIT10_06305 [Flavobacteriales bacterium]|nr:hypothetical protein [Flavobacteriales bacterium]